MPYGDSPFLEQHDMNKDVLTDRVKEALDDFQLPWQTMKVRLIGQAGNLVPNENGKLHTWRSQGKYSGKTVIYNPFHIIATTIILDTVGDSIGRHYGRRRVKTQMNRLWELLWLRLAERKQTRNVNVRTALQRELNGLDESKIIVDHARSAAAQMFRSVLTYWREHKRELTRGLSKRIETVTLEDAEEQVKRANLQNDYEVVEKDGEIYLRKKK